MRGRSGQDRYYLDGAFNTVIFMDADIRNSGPSGDTVSGFISGVGRISLEIHGLSAGTLGSLVNDLGTNAVSGFAIDAPSPQVIVSQWNGTSYDADTYLWVDHDGSGAGGAYLIGNFGSGTTIQSADILII